MAIKTVNSSDLMEFAAQRAGIPTTPKAVEEAVTKTEAKPETGVVGQGEETISTDPDPGEQPQKAPKPVQPRIDELVREKKEAEEFAEGEFNARIEAQRRVKELEEQVKALSVPAKEPEPELVEPDPSKYTDQAQFNKDWKEYQGKVIERTVAETLAKERAAERERQMQALMRERVALARKEMPDFDDVLKAAAASNKPVPGHIAAAIQESEFGPQIAYHLLKHPEDEERIYALSPAKAMLALGKIESTYERKAKAEAKAEAEPPKPPVITTKAPPPIASLKSDTGTVPTDLSQVQDFKEYRRLRSEQLRARRAH